MIGSAARPLLVTATFSPGDFGWLEGLRRRHFPAERNHVPAHLTLFHQLPPSAEAELARRLSLVTAAPPPKAEVTGIIDLGRGTALRIASPELEDVRAALAEELHGLLTPQDQAPWRPHVTIQNKVEPREARALQQQLRAGFEPRPLAIRGLASWRYLGGPWEPMRDYPFRR